MFADIQNLTGHSLERPALLDPVLSREIVLEDPQRFLLDSTIP